MNNIVRIDTNERLSRVVIHNRTAFLAGVTADDCEEDIVGQTRQVLQKVEFYLAKAGTHKGSLLTAQIWLKDIVSDFDQMNEVWDAWISPGAPPSRATAQAEMADPTILIEIIVTAAISE